MQRAFLILLNAAASYMQLQTEYNDILPSHPMICELSVGGLTVCENVKSLPTP